MSGARHCVPESLEHGERRRATCATASAPLTAATAEVPPLPSPPLSSHSWRGLRCGSLLRPERSERHQSRARPRPRPWASHRAGRAVGKCGPVEAGYRELLGARRTSCSSDHRSSTRSRRWRSTLRGSTSVAPCRQRSLTRILFAESCPGREAPGPPHRACDRRDELRFSGRCSSRAQGGPLPFPSSCEVRMELRR